MISLNYRFQVKSPELLNSSPFIETGRESAIILGPEPGRGGGWGEFKRNRCFHPYCFREKPSLFGNKMHKYGHVIDRLDGVESRRQAHGPFML